MKKNTIRLFALMLTLALVVLSFASCAKETPTETTTEAESTTIGDTTTEEVTGDTTEAPSANEGTTVDSASTTATSAGAAFELNSSDPAAVVALYQKAIAADVNKEFKNTQTLALEGDITGKGFISAIVKAGKSIVDSVVKGAGGEYNYPPGDYAKLSAADVTAATATADAQATTLKITLKEQTDGVNGVATEGPVGRGIGVLGGIDGVVKDLTDKGLKIDLSKGSVELKYTNASITLKIDNATGKIIEGLWTHKTNVSVKNVKIIGLNAEELNAVLLTEIKA